MLVNDMSARQIMGVYCMKNNVTGKILIGHNQSIATFKKRMTGELRMGLFRHQALQDDYNKYGVDAFEFSILERYIAENMLDVKKIDDDLLLLEEKWADKLSDHPQYIRVY